jgi:type II secretory pathway component PulC
MINKIKDFLKKKQSRKPSDNLSNQDEISSIDDRTGDHKIDNLTDTSAHSSLAFKDKVKTSIYRAQFYLNKLRANPQSIFSSLGSGGEKSLLSPNLNKAIEKILSRSSREPIHQFGLVLIICSITFTVAKISALVARGTPSLDQSQDFGISISLENEFNAGTLAQVKSINIFRTNTGLGGKKNIVADKKCDEAQQRSSLPIKLLNTIVLQDTVKSIASVQIRGERELQEFRVGDQISTFAKIFKISRLEILVKNLESGMCESITSDLKNSMSSSPISVMTPAQSRDFKANKKLPGIENNGNKFAISKTLLDDKLKDIAAVLTQAKAVKIQNPDGSLSFKMTELDPQGIFPYLGIQDQDIITSINGKPIYDMNEVMLLFGRIKGLDNLSLGIKRDGSESVQDYTIKK